MRLAEVEARGAVDPGGFEDDGHSLALSEEVREQLLDLEHRLFRSAFDGLSYAEKNAMFRRVLDAWKTP